MQILIFSKNEKHPTIPVRPGLSIRYIMFNTNVLEDLLLIARYRILNFPTSLVIDDRGKVLLKMRGTVPTSYINKLCTGVGND
jgi:hypothetical protein